MGNSFNKIFSALFVIGISYDASALALKINSPVENTAVTSKFTLKGNCNFKGAAIKISGNIANAGTAPCLSSNTFSYPVKIAPTTAAGNIVVTAAQIVGSSWSSVRLKYKYIGTGTTPPTTPPLPPTPTTTSTTIPTLPPPPPPTPNPIPIPVPGAPTGPTKAPTEPINMSTSLFVSPSGSDTNSGTQTKPWKTIQYGIDQLLPGQTLVVRAGRYPEEVIFHRSGLAGQPIRVVAYPGEQVLMDGADAITGWTKCPSSAACGGAAAYAKMYYAPYTRSALDGHLIDGDKPLFRAQWPEQPDAFYKEKIENFLKPVVISGTKISIVDPANLSSLPNLNGAYVYTWTLDNRIASRKVDSFDRATGKISFAEITNLRSTENYSLFNHISFLKKAGDYIIDEQAKRIYVIPSGLAQDVRISVRKNAIKINGQSFVTIDGLKIVGYSGPVLNQGLAVLNLIGQKISNLKIQNLFIIGNRSEVNYGVITVGDCTDCFFLGNRIEFNGNRGFMIGRSDRALIQGNYLTTNYGTCIYFGQVINSKIDKNTVVNNNGIHSNGISVYDASRDNQVTENFLSNANYALTIQASDNTLVERNFMSTAASRILVNYGSKTPDKSSDFTIVRYNTIINSGEHAALSNGANNLGFVAENNIIDGWGADAASQHTLTNNIFVGLSWAQKEATLGPKQFLYKGTLQDFFVDYAKGDFRVKTGTTAGGQDICKFSTEGKAVGAFGCGG